MLTILLGLILLGATAVGLWFALPVGGKVRPWLTPRIEPLVAIGFVMATGAGVIALLIGVSSVFQNPN